MTTIVLLAAAAVAATSLGLALMLCVAAARADRHLRNALLEALGWKPQDEWALLNRQQGAVPYKGRTAG
jgi:hypothetical protein